MRQTFHIALANCCICCHDACEDGGGTPGESARARLDSSRAAMKRLWRHNNITKSEISAAITRLQLRGVSDPLLTPDISLHHVDGDGNQTAEQLRRELAARGVVSLSGSLVHIMSHDESAAADLALALAPNHSNVTFLIVHPEW